MKISKQPLILMVSCFMLLQSGCNWGRDNNRTNPNTVRGLDFRANDARIALTRIGQAQYFPINEFLKVIGYHSSLNESNQSMLIGDTDPAYRIQVGSKLAEKEEQSITLSESPVMKDGQLFVPTTVLSDLFEQDIHYRIEKNEIIVRSVSDEKFTLDEMDLQTPATDSKAFFSDDPNDPFRDNGPKQNNFKAAAVKNINVNALINTAKRYKGTPYKFGAKPYPVSHKFDCASFAQYVFGRYGVKLRRVSRNQAKQGIPVSRKSLRKGDLVFFSVPGRFKSDKIVGHVGIYIGNGQMINTFSNKKGVHITSVNKGYWSRKYLGARRVVS
ncbi:NlpC/P60 family protein [Cohnella suwonensis]|uniref:NlpC/P60 family protein n=1 Tax=Cohnella suwonensis TaxID=696072 RepID=A0ABW0LX87_9BACL